MGSKSIDLRSLNQTGIRTINNNTPLRIIKIISKKTTSISSKDQEMLRRQVLIIKHFKTIITLEIIRVVGTT